MTTLASSVGPLVAPRPLFPSDFCGIQEGEAQEHPQAQALLFLTLRGMVLKGSPPQNEVPSSHFHTDRPLSCFEASPCVHLSTWITDQ